jgi:hypothetical protein
MGGMGGEVRGKTKLDTYKKFRARVDRKKIEDSTGLYMDAGNGTKQDLYRGMRKGCHVATRPEASGSQDMSSY